MFSSVFVYPTLHSTIVYISIFSINVKCKCMCSATLVARTHSSICTIWEQSRDMRKLQKDER